MPPTESGGSIVTSFKLEYDEIEALPSFTTIYEGNDLVVTVGETDGLVRGEQYRFILKAVNFFGESEPSIETFVALGRRPQKPDPPIKIEELSSQ